MGIEVVRAPSRRVHVTHPQNWAEAAATDYWANFGNAVGLPADAIGDLDLYGWVTTGFSHLAGSAADFLSSSDKGTTGGVNFDSANDKLISPFIFGDWAHQQMAAALLGYEPTTLNYECVARFAANNAEIASGFGFIIAGSSGALVQGDLQAFVRTDGTDFVLQDVTAGDAGSTDNTDPHLFRVDVSGTIATWFIDGVEQGAGLTIGLDEWPAAWGAGVQAAGANDPVVSWVHIWYS